MNTIDNLVYYYASIMYLEYKKTLGELFRYDKLMTNATYFFSHGNNNPGFFLFFLTKLVFASTMIDYIMVTCEMLRN